jgi:hypothetical protein
MGNPSLLLCDSDALTQFFLADEIRPLRELKTKYGIQPAIVQEVDNELRWMRKFKNRFVPQLDKALKATTLKVLDAAEFHSHISTAPIGASWASFQSLGSRYHGYVDLGEAYTFAAGVTLGFPALSNDHSAIRVLVGKMQSVPMPILRSFDLLAFCFHNGILLPHECETARTALLKESEGLPKAFEHASFENGIKVFNTRLQHGSPGIGASLADYRSTLTIAKL